MYENEVWKDIPHYEGLYQVSSWGRVKALPRERTIYNGGKWIEPEHMMKIGLTQDGYADVQLHINGKKKVERVHRLVALAFIPNPEGKPQVNHINCIRNDNRVENLEWVSREENTAHKVKCGNSTKQSIQCIETGQIFRTSQEASEANGGTAGNIRNSARSMGYYSVYGLHYKYIDKQ